MPRRSRTLRPRRKTATWYRPAARNNRRASFGPRVEKLEARYLLAATAVDDFYDVDQNTTLVAGADVAVELFPTGTTWDYLDEIGNSLAPGGAEGYPVDGDGDAWSEHDFNTATSTIGPWESGAALLGAGGIDGAPIQTVVDGIGEAPEGQNSVTTYLFRRSFDLADAAAVHRFDISILVDDGAVLYVNGTEILRVNMPAGTITTQTTTTNGDEVNYNNFSVDLSTFDGLLLTDGANTLAVEVHNVSTTSSDIGFDMSMSAVQTGGNSVLSNDTDAMEALLNTDVAHGELVLNPNGTFVYTPAPNFFGTDSFTYHASDIPTVQELIIAGNGPAGETWNYLHPTGGADPDLGDPDFDTTWYTNDGSYNGPAFSGSGQGLLGYGSFSYDSINTNIGTPADGNRYTAYFTSTFELDVDPVAVGSLIADVFADDGLHIYINGVRVGGLRMDGVVDNYHLLATGTGNESSTEQISLDTSSLVQGTNFIAVSVHQVGTSSSDLGFDLALTANASPDISDPATVTITVNDTNIPPVAADDAYTGAVNQPLDTLAAGLASVLENESPITEMGDASFAVVADDSMTDGTVVMDPASGHFVFTPDPNFKGVTTFTYTITDDDGTSDPATVSINVEGELITENQEAIAPLGSLVYRSEASPTFDASGHTHTFPVQLDAGQTVTLLADPQSAGLDVSLVLKDGSSAIVASSDSGGTGQDELIQLFETGAGGSYTVEVTSVAGTGDYTAQMILNAAAEEEEHGGASNDTAGTAQDLEGAFTALGGGSADRAAVLGTGSVAGDDWYQFSLASGQSATLAAKTFGSLDTVVQPLVAFDHTWQYNRTDNFASGWQNTTHPPGRNWSSGQGLLGVEDSTLAEPIRTTFSSYSSSRITYYFQSGFNFAGDPNDIILRLRHMVDDGAVFYLNDQEIHRTNMPAGTVDSGTTALDGVGNAGLSSFVTVPSDALVLGANRLSVEVHQAGEGSSDIIFGMELQAETAVDPVLELYDPGMNLVASGVASDEIEQVIENFTATQAGTYSIRLAGTESQYNLVVTRGATLNIEPNDGPAPEVQDITGSGGALGSVTSGIVTGESVVFAVFGDWGTGGSGPDFVADMVTDTDWEVDFIATTGDNNYGNTSVGSSAWDAFVGARYGDYILGRADNAYPNQTGEVQRFFPSVGNHDASSGSVAGYVDYFHSDPGGDPDGRLPTGVHNSGESYYDFQWGPVHMFAVDSENRSSAQMEWLEEAMTNSDAQWKFVYFHHAAYTSANHGSDAGMQWDFAEWGADAVFQGHDHTYERILNPSDGLPYFVTGLGGNGMYNFGTPVAGSEVRYRDTLGSMRVTVDAGSATFEFLSIADGANGQNGGQLIDTYTIEKAPPLDVDQYSLDVSAGQQINLETFTPAGGPFEFANVLDPNITLLDPTGAVVAMDDNGAGDGRNAQISEYEALLSGTYTIVVEAGEGTGGEYFLDVNVGEDEPAATVEGRHVFYNDSFFDDATFGNDDDTAIDPTKSALLPGQTATNANYISYTRGINGIMVDIANPEGTVDAADFEFHDMGRNGDTPTAAQAPDSITVRPGEGVGGSDRVIMTWDTSAGIVFDTTWLRVTVLESVGLDAADVFYFGSAPGEGSGGEFAHVDPADELGARNNTHGFGNPATVDDPWDYNKDRFVDPVDQLFARNNGTGFTTRLNLMSAPAAGLLSAGLSSGESNGGPTAAALIGGESGWSTLDSDVLGDSSTGGGSSAAADDRIWSEADDEAVLVGSGANSSSANSSSVDGALSEDADWLAWDVL
ncbi:MAG: Ig-like domain-containing protein [Pirellulales bacterium]